MQELRCRNCNKFLGNIIRGKIHKDIVILCKDCGKLAVSDKVRKALDTDLPDFLKDMLKC